MTEPKPEFLYEEHPDHPGWMKWGFKDETRYTAFLGEMIVRRDGGRARVRMTPERRHSNLANVVHGGAMLGFIDVSLFAAARSFGLITAGTAVTLDLNTHFIGGGRIGEPLEAEVELLRETGRLLFLRGVVLQGDREVVAEFSGTIRKPSAPRN
ncbi:MULTISPECIES: PaaI family thioesterase [Sphingomonas]|uniref:PaaI family thioesterase n=1 Tax=Sphingomonas lycopersici TaxID=2951807 RepID=A0AA41ZHR4_9SPHN|nr:MULTISPECIES: PaaI family thioesterase [Sphingomonas]MCW6530526.1 PaaI family thioesterase [Sphingomonas lycopersici]MCW6537174.1 PaaI family thioesterase [Sphingomonas lycopersici]OJU15441.1 MAG: phenylacetic acid degradation protein [Sphingomonas sp. 66-10]